MNTEKCFGYNIEWYKGADRAFGKDSSYIGDGYKVWMKDTSSIYIKDPTRVLQRPHFDVELEMEILRVRYELYKEERMGLLHWCIYMLIKKIKKWLNEKIYKKTTGASYKDS